MGLLKRITRKSVDIDGFRAGIDPGSSGIGNMVSQCNIYSSVHFCHTQTAMSYYFIITYVPLL
jgi:hypothetical protein